MESGQLSFERHGISDPLLHQCASPGMHKFFTLALSRKVPAADELGVQREGQRVLRMFLPSQQIQMLSSQYLILTGTSCKQSDGIQSILIEKRMKGN